MWSDFSREKRLEFKGRVHTEIKLDRSLKSDLNVDDRIRTEIDLNECEHFLN